MLVILLALACTKGEGDTVTTDTDAGDSDTDVTDTDTDDTGPVDADGDGSFAPDDCDDADPDVHPGADETCDGRDDDCDGAVDEDATDARALYEDADGDDYGVTKVTACPGDGYTTHGGDCDDADATIYPGAVEVCGDRIDQDCHPETCRLTGTFLDPFAYATADVTWAWPSSAYTWGAWADVDGDGYDDGIIASFVNSTQSGVGVEWGGATVASASLPGVTSYTIPSGEWAEVVDAGDIDGDGFADVLTATRAHAWVVYGGSTHAGAASMDTDGVPLGGYGVDDVAFVGDLDGDGAGDWVAEDSVTALLIYGSTTRLTAGLLADVASGAMTGVGSNDPYGMMGGGDFDGDGLADLFVCGGESVGLGGPALYTLSVFYGDAARRSGSWTDADADARFAAYGWQGMYTDCGPADVGDVDGDGFDELGFAASGYAWVWPGGSTRWSGDIDATTAPAAYVSAGDEVDARVTGGDFDGDGFSDVAVGLAWSGWSNSSVRVFYGSSSPWGTYDVHKDYDVFVAGQHNYGVAIAVDLAGDVNGDDHADLLGVEAGQLDGAWVFFGSGD